MSSKFLPGISKRRSGIPYVVYKAKKVENRVESFAMLQDLEIRLRREGNFL